MSEVPTRESVLEALRHVVDPELGRSLVDLGMIRDVVVEGTQVRLTLALTTLACPLKTRLADAVRDAAAGSPGIEAVSVETVLMTPEERIRLLAAPRPPAPSAAARRWWPWS